MKLDIFLFIFALALAFFSGNINYFLKSQSQGDFNDLTKIKNLHLDVQEELPPFKRLDLNLNYPSVEQLKLLTTDVDLDTKRNSFIDSTDCLRSSFSQRSSNFINKETLWMTYYCNQVDSLPSNFYVTPPYLAPSGHSYAFLKLKLLQTKKQQIEWLNNYSHLMNIRELKRVQWYKDSTQHFLINQPDHIIKSIASGESIFMDDNFYFIKTGNLKYFILKLNKAKRFFKRTPYSFSSSNTGCLFKIGNVCWKKERANIHNFLSQSMILLFIGTIIILILTANSLFARFRKKKQEEDRKKHALRILTHELRTPISSLLMHTDIIQRSLTELPHEIQEEFLKIEGQIYRLKHLAQKSLGYLQTDSSKLIHLNNQNIESLEEYCQDILFEYQTDEIQLKIEDNLSLNTDPYWLRMCITNLIENAIRYGKAPYILKVTNVKNHIYFGIQDHGDPIKVSLKSLLKSKHINSKGLGLGLIIVEKTIKEMNGELILKTNPNEFIIKLPVLEVENE